MKNKECPICYEKLGRIYKELPCGHRYHYKCIKIYENLKKNENLKCCYCREPYRIMKLRDRKLTGKEQNKKLIFCNSLKNLLNNVSINKELNTKVIVVNNIFKIIIKEIDMIKNQKFNFNTLLPIVINKLSDLSFEINKLNIEGKINEKQYSIFNKNKLKLEYLI